MKGISVPRIRRGWAVFSIVTPALFAGALLYSRAANADEFGAIAGEFAAANGVASYTIPIQMAPGVAGMQPEVSFNYSSQGGNGLLGLGWSVGGASVIHRCAKTLVQDGVRGIVNLDAEDRYCLDGQRLILISGVYGEAGSEYRTEIEGFSRITAVGGTPATGPDNWIVRTKAGQTLEFGATADARRLTPVSSLYPTAMKLNWMVDRISDAVGNALSFTYHNDRASGEQYLQRIDYAENSVRFEYDLSRPDKVTSYSNGFVTTLSYRLKQVASYAGTAMVRSYTPTYEITPTTSQSRIASLKECAGNGDCLPETYFGYDGGLFATLGYPAATSLVNSNFTMGHGGWNEAEFPRMMADVDGDGLEDIVGFAGAGVSVRLSSGEGFTTLSDFGSSRGWEVGKHPRMMADVNGDGRADVVGFAGDGVYYALSQGTYFSPKVKWVSSYGYNAGGWRVDKHIRQLADLDGDGKADIVGFGGDGVYVSVSEGSRFAPPVKWINAFVQSDLDIGYRRFPKRCLKQTTGTWQIRELSDVNGDGLADIVGFGMDGVYVSLSTGRGFINAVKWSDKFGYRTGEAYVLNRDIFTDYCKTKVDIYGWNADKHPRIVNDLNGDGMGDIVGFADNGVYVSLSLGDSFSQPVKWAANQYGFNDSAGGWNSENKYPRMLSDINGDGLADIVGFSYWKVIASLNPLPHADNLVSITDGNGITTGIEYATLAGPNDFYEKPGERPVGTPEDTVSLQIPHEVVTRVSTSNGLGGSNSVSYRYGGLRANRQGRGILGFEWTETINNQTGSRNKTTFSQEFPHIGTPIETRTWAGDGTLLSYTTNTPAVKRSHGDRVFFPYSSKSVSTEYELDGSPVKTEEVRNDLYDDYGNVVEMSTIVSGGGTTHETINTNTYNNDPAKWHLGRLSRSVVTQKTTNSEGTRSQTRASAFAYDPGTGLLVKEVVAPDQASLTLTTAYQYDNFGNKTQSTVSGSGLSEPRTTTTQYDPQGRYPLWTENAKGHREEYVYDPLCGKKTSLTGPNSLPTTWSYDSFCRIAGENRADGTRTVTSRYRLLDGTRYAARPIGLPAVQLYPLANVAYKIVTATDGQPTTTVYYDQLGRELRKETVGFDCEETGSEETERGNGVRSCVLPFAIISYPIER